MSFFSAIGAAAGAYFGGPVGAAVGLSLGSVIDGQRGQEDANRQNQRLYEDNRDWQERMSNTAVQRAAIDMRNAGFNPLLATGAQASTPSATPPVMENTAKGYSNVPQAALGAVSAVQTAAKNEAEIANLNQSNKLLAAQEQKAKAETLNTTVDTAVKKKGIPESEIKNDLYDIIRPFIKKGKELFRTNAHPKVPLKGSFWNRPNEQLQDAINRSKLERKP